MKRSVMYRVLAPFLAVCLPACATWSVRPTSSLNPAPRRPIARAVVLHVNDKAIDWPGAHLGEVVRDTLMGTGAFEQVYYPVEPANPPSLRLTIEAYGSMREHPGVTKVVVSIIGFGLPLLTGLMGIEKTFKVDATIVLADSGHELRRFSATASATASYTIWSSTQEYEAAAGEAVFKRLGREIAASL